LFLVGVSAVPFVPKDSYLERVDEEAEWKQANSSSPGNQLFSTTTVMVVTEGVEIL